MNNIINELKGIESPELEEFTNTDVYPTIDIPDRLTDLFLLDDMDEKYRNKHFDYYKYKGIGVPRATKIIRQCMDDEYLASWAAKLGKQYYSERNRHANIGSKTHELIEDFLTTGRFNNKIFFSVPNSIKRNVSTAFNNFKEWMNTMASKGYFISDIIAIEKVITCPYFGGTIDCICRINGKVYIIDFKTSRQISPDYLLQVCAYMWICNAGYVENIPHIDGVGIIRVDKENDHKFEDLFLNYEVPWQAEIIDRYISNFGVMLQAYYTILSAEKGFSKIKKSVKNTFDVLEGKD